jgi:hypothetical protein
MSYCEKHHAEFVQCSQSNHCQTTALSLRILSSQQAISPQSGALQRPTRKDAGSNSSPKHLYLNTPTEPCSRAQGDASSSPRKVGNPCSEQNILTNKYSAYRVPCLVETTIHDPKSGRDFDVSAGQTSSVVATSQAKAYRVTMTCRSISEFPWSEEKRTMIE